MIPCENKSLVFFVDPGEDAEAKQICKECPFQTNCLDRALRIGATYGVWAGVNFGNHKEINALPLHQKRKLPMKTGRDTERSMDSVLKIAYDGISIS